MAKDIVEELRKAGFKNVDLLIVDYFLYEVWRAGDLTQRIEIREEPEEYDFDHNEIRDFIRAIGMWLGFEAETEKIIGHGARVDVIWRAKIANLGVVTYVFEVHKSGPIDSLILNLQKAIRNPTVQKVIAVSDRKQLEKIKKEALTSDRYNQLDITVGFLFISGLKALKDELSHFFSSGGKLRIIMGSLTNRQTYEQLSMAYHSIERLKDIKNRTIFSTDTNLHEHAEIMNENVNVIEQNPENEEFLDMLTEWMENESL